MPIVSKKKKRTRYVLVVESNTHHAELITEILDRHFSPVIVHAVDSIDDAIDLAETSFYDLILSEAVLSGNAIMKDLARLRNVTNDIPIIVISGQGDEGLAANIIKHGASEYISKTRDALKTLPDILKKHMDARHKKRSSNKKKLKEFHEDQITPADVLREVDKIMSYALAITDSERRGRSRNSKNMEQMDKLLYRIKRLRDLVSKLS